MAPPNAIAAVESRDGPVRAGLAIINDPSAPAADRLRAIESLENRALGRPTERVEQVTNPVDEAIEEGIALEDVQRMLADLDDLPEARPLAGEARGRLGRLATTRELWVPASGPKRAAQAVLQEEGQRWATNQWRTSPLSR